MCLFAVGTGTKELCGKLFFKYQNNKIVSFDSMILKGMRFALIEMKLTLVKLLQKFNVKSTPNTPTQLSYVEGTVRRPKNGIPIVLEKRQAR